MNTETPGTSVATDKASLVALLAPILARVADLRPEFCSDAAVAELERILGEDFPVQGELVRRIGESIEAGIAGGWLCDRGDPDARFSRVAKPSEATFGLSIDVVRLAGAALRHGHPKGEVTLAFTVEGEPQFCGRGPGWIFAKPGSVHVPEVNAGRMNLIYFLPDGAVDWTPPAAG
ncbi:MAG TPA: DUF4863 family protein [Nannocystis exedens]|nr:DUF4863 family protein [Nannocystis exedens]